MAVAPVRTQQTPLNPQQVRQQLLDVDKKTEGLFQKIKEKTENGEQVFIDEATDLIKFDSENLTMLDEAFKPLDLTYTRVTKASEKHHLIKPRILMSFIFSSIFIVSMNFSILIWRGIDFKKVFLTLKHTEKLLLSSLPIVFIVNLFLAFRCQRHEVKSYEAYQSWKLHISEFGTILSKAKEFHQQRKDLTVEIQKQLTQYQSGSYLKLDLWKNIQARHTAIHQFADQYEPLSTASVNVAHSSSSMYKNMASVPLYMASLFLFLSVYLFSLYHFRDKLRTI